MTTTTATHNRPRQLTGKARAMTTTTTTPNWILKSGQPMRLLTRNAKLLKVAHWRIRSFGLELAPHTLSGVNLCAWAGWCAEACNMEFSGRKVMKTSQRAALARTEFMLTDPNGFHERLSFEIEREYYKALRDDCVLFIRGNAASDTALPQQLARRFPLVRFYDYTKARHRIERYLRGDWLPNYDLCYSVDETRDEAWIRSVLERGGNVAVVLDRGYVPSAPEGKKYKRPLPARWYFAGRSFPCIDGDKYDTRIPQLDGRGVVVVLALKGTNAARQRALDSGFSFPINY